MGGGPRQQRSEAVTRCPGADNVCWRWVFGAVNRKLQLVEHLLCDFMVALLPLFVLLTLFLVTARVAAVALEATGVARETAQFQARSVLMGVGYTTSESEDITSHPVRRRIVLWLMTFGNASIITGVGGFLLTFVNAEKSQTLRRSVVLTVGVMALLLLFHTKPANRLIEFLTRAALRRFTDLDIRDYAALLRFDREYEVTEIHTRSGEWIVGRPLSALHLTHEGVVVLGIHRQDGTFLGTPTGDTVIEPGDQVLAYGRVEVLHELATRPARSGDELHQTVSASHQRLIADHEGDQAAG